MLLHIKKHVLLYAFFVFCLLNIMLYAGMVSFHNLVPFNTFNYQSNAYHYLADQRVSHGSFDLLRALGQFDSQWYLRIAHAGYPNLLNQPGISKKINGGELSYAFLPLYPLLLYLMDVNHQLELSAFLLSNALLVLNFCSLFFVLNRLTKQNIALQTIFLLFFAPFSIFFRSYYAEGLFLFCLTWFAYFLIRREFWLSGLALSTLFITKGNSFPLYFLYIFYLIRQHRTDKLPWPKLILLFSLPLIPFLGWLVYCDMQTGNALFFFRARQAWSGIGPTALIGNLWNLIRTPFLPLHTFHQSQLDNLVLLSTLLVLILSRRSLKPELWWIAFSLWIVHVVGQDTMSFTRSQSVSFPLFLYIATIFQAKRFYLLFFFSLALLFLVSILFVNWYWIG